MNEGVTLGEEAHIVAESDHGPRANPQMPQKERDSYANMILLCEEHHKVIDASNGRYFSIEVLLEMKREHEERVAKSMGDPAKETEAAAERAADFVSEWERRVEIDKWDGWTSSLLAPTPVMGFDQFERFFDTSLWLQGRSWPTSHFSKFRQADRIFTEVWADLIQTISDTFAHHRIARDRFCLHEKHKEISWNEQLYREYGDEFDFNVDIIHELVFHLTSAGNLMIQRIRQEIQVGYRFSEGNLRITHGPNEMLRFEHFSPSYSEDEQASENPYPGLDKIKEFVADQLRNGR
ncbi:HNH endonuclease [Streptomyces olivochromogenes]|nr:HNH endonuclease [Streptomyces olivochromogenes]